MKVISDPKEAAALSLLKALWRNPQLHHHLGTFVGGPREGYFRQIKADVGGDLVTQIKAVGNADVLVACSEFAVPGSRKRVDAASAAALWLDIDCGEDKVALGRGYPTAEDARRHMTDFCAAAGLPDPTHVIGSGGGIHVYWVLSVPLSAAVWQEAAGKFKQVVAAHGLLADSSRTADIASFLRVPGTLNYKYTPPRAVELLFEANDRLDTASLLERLDAAHALIPAPEEPSPANEGPRMSLDRISALLEDIDPSCSYEDWLKVLMAIFYETDGSEEGLRLAMAWSSDGNDYPGAGELRAKWASFDLNYGRPITGATLVHMAKKSEVLQPAEYEVVELNTLPNTGPSKNPFAAYSLRGQADRLGQELLDEVHVLGEVALSGELTVFYAAPNTGKTLLTISMLCKSIEMGKVDPSKVYYLNMDDNARGLHQKLQIAEAYRFEMLAEGRAGFKASMFPGVMEQMIVGGYAKGVVIILDTLKKFTDIMNKRTTSEFSVLLRRFSMAGGTVIALAHTNKHADAAGNPIFAGTSDIREDFDCMFILKCLQAGGAGRRVVKFQKEKERGTVSECAFSYSLAATSYLERLNSIRAVDLEELSPIEEDATPAGDGSVIQAIRDEISKGTTNKGLIVDAVRAALQLSKAKVLQVIESHSAPTASRPLWRYSRGAHGAMHFELVDSLSPT